MVVGRVKGSAENDKWNENRKINRDETRKKGEIKEIKTRVCEKKGKTEESKENEKIEKKR